MEAVLFWALVFVGYPLASGLSKRLSGKFQARNLEELLEDPETELAVRRLLEHRDKLEDEEILEAAAKRLLEDPEMFDRVTRAVQEGD